MLESLLLEKAPFNAPNDQGLLWTPVSEYFSPESSLPVYALQPTADTPKPFFWIAAQNR